MTRARDGLLWLPVFEDLLDNAKTWKLAAFIKDDEVRAAGHLVSLWLWALRKRPSGIFEPDEGIVIAKAMRYKGDAEAMAGRWPTDGLPIGGVMAEIGWLDRIRGGKAGTRLELHDWPVYVGLLRSVAKAREGAKADRRPTDTPPIDPPPPQTIDRRPGTVDSRPKTTQEDEGGGVISALEEELPRRPDPLAKPRLCKKARDFTENFKNEITREKVVEFIGVMEQTPEIPEHRIVGVVRELWNAREGLNMEAQSFDKDRLFNYALEEAMKRGVRQVAYVCSVIRNGVMKLREGIKPWTLPAKK